LPLVDINQSLEDRNQMGSISIGIGKFGNFLYIIGEVYKFDDCVSD